MFIILGESASGKTSVEREIEKNYGIRRIISYTTRPERPKEVDGLDYNFVTRPEFIGKVVEGFFMETTIYDGYLYGTAKEDYERKGLIVMDPIGLRRLKKIREIELVSVYIKTKEETRMNRLIKRGMNTKEAKNKILKDRDLFKGIEKEVDYVVDNNKSLKETTEQVGKIFEEYLNLVKI